MADLDDKVKSRALAAANALAREGRVLAAYVFGSHAEGRADKWSDIDLAAFMEGVESWDPWNRAKVIVKVQKEVGFDIETHILSAASLENPEAGSFASNILNHGVRIL